MSQQTIVIKDSLKVQVNPEAGNSQLVTLSLKGYLDTYNSADFQREINKLIEKGFVKIVFNCAELNYVSSTGIGAFTAFLKAVKPQNGDLVLAFLQPKVFEVFQLLGFSKFFNISNNIDEAKNILKGAKKEPTASVFPKIFKCPICKKSLKATRSGRFRCSECKTILSVDPKGNVILG